MFKSRNRKPRESMGPFQALILRFVSGEQGFNTGRGQVFQRNNGDGTYGKVHNDQLDLNQRNTLQRILHLRRSGCNEPLAVAKLCSRGTEPEDAFHSYDLFPDKFAIGVEGSSGSPGSDIAFPSGVLLGEYVINPFPNESALNFPDRASLILASPTVACA